MTAAAALSPPPPLLARELTGADPVAPELRQACRDAVAGLLRGHPEVVAVVGAGGQTGTWDSSARLDVSAFAPGIDHAVRNGSTRPDWSGFVSPIGAAAWDGSPGLPLPLGLGARLLDQAEYAGPP